MAVNACSAESVICALKVAVVKHDTPCSDERTQVQSRNETAVPNPVVIAVANDKLSLHDSISAFLPVQCGVTFVVKVDIAVIAKRDILRLDLTARNVQHGEVACSAMRLSAVASQHHIFWVVALTY
jgi:hypothetical protein